MSIAPSAPRAPTNGAIRPEPEPVDQAPVHLVAAPGGEAEAWAQLLVNAGHALRCFDSAAVWRRAAALSDGPAPVVVLMLGALGSEKLEAAIAELDLPACPGAALIVASPQDDLAARLAAHRGGARRYLLLPGDGSLMLKAVGQLARLGQQPPYRVLMVDDDARLLALHMEMLRDAGMVVQGLVDPLRVLDAIDAFRPDVLVLDVFMPEVSGLELAAVLRERQALLPILFLSGETDLSQHLLALALGGDDFLVKPVRHDHLVAAVRARARRVRVSEAVRQRLETTVYERERQHLALDQHALVSISDQSGAIIYANDRFCSVSGYERAELLGVNHRILKSGLHSAEFYAGMWQVISCGGVWQGEICNRRKDGSLYWVESTITPFMDAQGKPYQFVAIRTDISHVKAAEQALRESEQRHRQTLECAELATIEWDIVTGDFRFNERWAELRGRRWEDMAPSMDSWVLSLHPDDLDETQRLLRVHLEGLTPMFQAEYRVRGAAGHWIWLLGRGAVVQRNAEGKPLRMAGTEMDISARKRSEEMAEFSKDRLRRAQIFANIGTWEWSVQTGDLYWSERIAPLFGYPAGDLETSYENFLAAVHPDDREAVQNAVQACVRNDTRYELEHRVVWPDGTVRWLHESGAVLRDAQGKALQMLGVVQDIHVRKCAEIALAERERQLREAQELAGLGNWSVDLVTGSHYWSDEVYHIFGRSRSNYQPSVESFFDAVHPEDRHLVMPEAAGKVGGLGIGAHDVVHRIVRPDGTVRHVHELAESETDARGRIVRIRGTVQDISERVEAETRLRESEERFAFAVEGAGDGVWDWDMPSGAMRFSRLYMAMLGYQEFELPHHVDTWTASVHPDDMARVRKRLEGYLDGSMSSYAVELRLRCKDGSYKWILCRGDLISRDRDGQPLRMIGIHSDITERKRAELALVESQSKLMGLFELSPLGIVLTDMSGRFVEFNEAFRSITGYSAAELHELDYWALTPEQYRESEAAQSSAIQRFARYGPYEKEYRRKDGSLVPVRLNGIVVSDQAGASMIWSIVEDVTDSRRAQEEMAAARDEAQRANHAKSEFLSSMSHELRTPMNAILGFGQLMECDPALPAEHRDSAQEILKAGHHLLTLINEVLDLAKVESGQLQLSIEAVELVPVVRECMSLVAVQADASQVSLHGAPLAASCLLADRTRLKQALLNLLSNAIKYNRVGGSVSIASAVQPGGMLRLTVSDTGPGIAPHQLSELFEPFNRLDAEYSDVEGTGIGLTITRRLVECMGGAIGVQSSVGVGSSFWIELPVQGSPPAGDEAPVLPSA